MGHEREGGDTCACAMSYNRCYVCAGHPPGGGGGGRIHSRRAARRTMSVSAASAPSALAHSPLGGARGGINALGRGTTAAAPSSLS